METLTRTCSGRFGAGVREKDRAAVFRVDTLAAVGVLEEAFHFPGARNLPIEFDYLAAREYLPAVGLLQ